MDMAFIAVLWIRIRMFLGLLDPQVTSTVQIRLRTFHPQAKIVRKTLFSTVCDFF